MKQAIFLLLFLVTTLLSGAQKGTRDSLLAQLSLLKEALIQSEKEKVSHFFRFPLSDAELKMKAELNGDPELQIARLDQKTFLDHYDRIIPEELAELFRELDLARLRKSNIVRKEVTPKNGEDNCYYGYSIQLERSEVRLTFFINTRKDIELSEDDICPEYSESWTFVLVNGKLRFQKVGIAG